MEKKAFVSLEISVVQTSQEDVVRTSDGQTFQLGNDFFVKDGYDLGGLRQ